MAANRIDLTGKVFGKLIVLSYNHTYKKVAFWLCLCECGTHKIINGANLRYGHTASCGCIAKETSKQNILKTRIKNITHGQSGTNKRTGTYISWYAMLQRCTNPKNIRYSSYGMRGISVCASWYSFVNFFKDMGERPTGKTLDRIDNDGNYESSNCRWTTVSEQNFNRSPKLLFYNGIGRTLADWADELNISKSAICRRLKLGWSLDKALSVKKYETRSKQNK